MSNKVLETAPPRMLNPIPIERIFLSAMLSLLVGANSVAAAEKPNVIVVLTDDQGYGDLSCHGNPVLKTPQLDRLHAESLRFTDFHVAPMCSPTRGEILTGIYAFRNGATAVCQGRSMPRRELPTLAQLFKRNGYATAHFGKWHLGDSYPFRPQDRGFDLSIHNQAWGVKSLAEFWKNDCTDDKYWRNNQLDDFPGYNTDVFFDEAMTWMIEQDGPFFVYLATTAAHSPFNVPAKYTEPYRSHEPSVRNFFGMIAKLDENIGRLETFLKENGLRDNTILIFITDNGTVNGERIFNAGMRGKKTMVYDGGHRVPFFLRWPAGQLGNARNMDALAHSTDVLPTLIELCGLQQVDNFQYDGRSLAPLIRPGKVDNAFSERMLVIQYGAEFQKWHCAVLWNKWRLVNGIELYNVAADPGQRENLYSKRPKIVSAMRDYYEQWCGDTQPVMEQTNYFGIGVDEEPVTWLSSCNWTGSYCDSWGNLASGICLGSWNLEVESTGDYEVTMYLFHPDSHTPLNKPLQQVPARPITKAKLIIDGKEVIVDIHPGETHATFQLSLEKDDKVVLEGQFLDAMNKPLFGAPYTFVRKALDR